MKSLLISLATVLGSLMLSQPALACSCIRLGGDFNETIRLHDKKIADGEWPATSALSIVSAKVKEYKQLRRGPHPTEMVLEITNVVRGEIKTPELIVEGDNGFQCRPYVTNFDLGKEYLFALRNDGGVYYLSSCGSYSKEITQ